MTVIRHSSADLLLHSPIKMDSELLKSVKSLGDVSLGELLEDDAKIAMGRAFKDRECGVSSQVGLRLLLCAKVLLQRETL